MFPVSTFFMTSKRDLKLESDVLEKQPLTISFRKLIVPIYNGNFLFRFIWKSVSGSYFFDSPLIANVTDEYGGLTLNVSTKKSFAGRPFLLFDTSGNVS